MSELIQFDGRTVAVIAPEDLEALEADNERLLGLLRRGFAFSANCEADPEQPETFRRKAAEWASEAQEALAGAADQPAAAPQAPIARVSVWACLPPSVTLYAPGLPPGEYDLYCEPEATAPMLRAADNSAAQPDSVPTITPHDDPCLLVAGRSEDFIGGSISDQPDAAREIERANLVYERGAFVLMELMKAYERRVRSDCKSQADLDAKPWECAEYRAAADFLRKTWPTPAAADQPDAASTNSPEVSSGLVVPFYYRLQDKRDPYRYMNFDPNAWNFILVPAVPGEGVVGYSAADNSPGIPEKSPQK